MQTSELGLRERKRAETRDRLETAAVTLVLKGGFDHTTLDAICAAADVSPRTFFNYFDNKEDAVLGLAESEFSNEVVGEVRSAYPGADVVELSIRLLFRVLSPSIASSKLLNSRMTIVRQHPHLLGRMANQMQRRSDQLAAVIQPDLRESARSKGDDPAAAELLAEAVLALCGGAARMAVREWAANGNQTPIEAVEERAIDLARSTVKAIS